MSGKTVPYKQQEVVGHRGRQVSVMMDHLVSLSEDSRRHPVDEPQKRRVSTVEKDPQAILGIVVVHQEHRALKKGPVVGPALMKTFRVNA